MTKDKYSSISESLIHKPRSDSSGKEAELYTSRKPGTFLLPACGLSLRQKFGFLSNFSFDCENLLKKIQSIYSLETSMTYIFTYGLIKISKRCEVFSITATV